MFLNLLRIIYDFFYIFTARGSTFGRGRYIVLQAWMTAAGGTAQTGEGEQLFSKSSEAVDAPQGNEYQCRYIEERI